jgi:nucleotide-binding universal stress UspA family protein
MAGVIRTILAASDFSFSAHRAARRAATLARTHGAALRLLHVLDRSSVKTLFPDTPGVDVDLLLRSEAERELNLLAENLGGAVTDRLLREGRVLDEIVAEAAGADLLVLGPRGLNPLRDFVLGSTAERLARKIECPMLVVKQDPEVPYQNVLVPVDFSECSAPALRFASELAPGVALHAFHAFDCSLEGRLRSAGVTDERIADYRQEQRREAEARMQELTRELPDVSTMVHPGDARVLINDRAAAIQSTLIVMGKQSRSWLSEYVLGSVTRLVLERASCDVVVVPNAHRPPTDARAARPA